MAAGEPEIVTVEQVTTAVVRDVVPAAELAGFFDRAFSTLPAACARQGVNLMGAALALYLAPPGEAFDLEVGFPTDRPVLAEGEVVPGSLPAGRVARSVHHGSYEELSSSWEALGRWIGEQGLTPGDRFWEVYLTQPSPEMDPADLRTELNWLLAE